ncbi:MAG TPA: biotin/lipoyl-containing protein, partial [Labilithrix sp.]|nr:biotin/lipoyl-containing protein [Labilithrix sp.]
FGDTHGNYVHLFERDCSVQRRHQKVLEEAPAPGLSDAVRARMGETAVLAAKAVSYVGAGTVELIIDRSGTFYFMEMNTRLQVEHPVTEQITGLDLVEWQLRVAAGEPLPRTQSQIGMSGHSIEARIYAENPDAEFVPSIGKLVHLAAPAESRHVRIDTGVEQGDEITPHYDPMIAKLIVWGADRAEALRQMQMALDHYEVVGVANNVEFLGRLVRTASFTKPALDTSLIEREHAALRPPAAEVPDDVWHLAALAEVGRLAEVADRAEPGSPWSRLDGWRLGAVAPHLVTLRRGEVTREVRATLLSKDRFSVTVAAPDADEAAPAALVTCMRSEGGKLRLEVGDRSLHASVVASGGRRFVFAHGRRFDLEIVDPLHRTAGDDVAEGGLRAPMPGKVIAHLATVGTRVTKGTPLMVLEAMKMEMTVTAPRDGLLESFRYAPGEQVPEGAELVIIVEAP